MFKSTSDIIARLEAMDLKGELRNAKGLQRVLEVRRAQRDGRPVPPRPPIPPRKTTGAP